MKLDSVLYNEHDRIIEPMSADVKKMDDTTDYLENQLDALFVATNAPGRIAYNWVERRMASFSHDHAGPTTTSAAISIQLE